MTKENILMDFTDLKPSSPTFDENEAALLRALPKTKEGLIELLSHLDSFDSHAVWQFLIEEFVQLMTDEQYRILKERARLALGDDGLPELLPYVFGPSADDAAPPLDPNDIFDERNLTSEMRDYFMDGMK